MLTAGAHLAWKKGSVAEGQLLIRKPHILLRLEIDRWICNFAKFRKPRLLLRLWL